MSVNHFPNLRIVMNPENNPCIQNDRDRHRNLVICLLAHCQPSLTISRKCLWKFLCKVANRHATKLNSMRWFSHWRRTGGRKAAEDRTPEDCSCKMPSACTAVTLSPPSCYAMVLAVDVCSIMAYGACFTMHCQWGWLRRFLVFCPWSPWPLTPNSNSGRFLYNAPNR